MLGLIIWIVAISAIVGLVIKFGLDRVGSGYEITWVEFGVALVAISLVTAPLSAWAGWNMAKNSKLSFNEYWNGYELDTSSKEITCSKNGPCHHEYDCDPYTHIHTRTVTDSKGNSRTETYTETHWNSCPYASHEYSYYVDTTLGEYTIADHIFAENPREWRSGSGIPSGVERGIPPLWQAATDRVAAGDPGPVTKRMSYDNYILASDASILKEYSDTISKFQEAGLLPPVQNDVRDHYFADKVYFVGTNSTDRATWQERLAYLNAGLGTELQGDLHLVIVADDLADEAPDDYVKSLKAYWSDPREFGDDSISKNSIIVVLGTESGVTVDWARATTGMPQGNEGMLLALQNELEGLRLDPEDIVGDVGGDFFYEEDEGEREKEVRATHGTGALETILWGLEDEATRFQRVSMTSNDEGDVGGGFLYLDSEIQPSGGQRGLIIFVGTLFAALAWVGVALYGARLSGRNY